MGRSRSVSIGLRRPQVPYPTAIPDREMIRRINRSRFWEMRLVQSGSGSRSQSDSFRLGWALMAGDTGHAARNALSTLSTTAGPGRDHAFASARLPAADPPVAAASAGGRSAPTPGAAGEW